MHPIFIGKVKIWRWNSTKFDTKLVTPQWNFDKNLLKHFAK